LKCYLQEPELRYRIDRGQSPVPSSTRYYDSRDRKVRELPPSAFAAGARGFQKRLSAFGHASSLSPRCTNSRTSALGEAIERWLRLTGVASWDESTLLDDISVAPPPQRFHALHEVLRRRPDLAARAAHLELLEQLRLSLDLVGEPQALRPRAVVIQPAANFAGCRAIRRNRRSAWH
jgi:hypothetical protein